MASESILDISNASEVLMDCDGGAGAGPDAPPGTAHGNSRKGSISENSTGYKGSLFRNKRRLDSDRVVDPNKSNIAHPSVQSPVGGTGSGSLGGGGG